PGRRHRWPGQLRPGRLRRALRGQPDKRRDPPDRRPVSAGEPVSRSLQLGTGLRYHVLEWGGDRPDLDHTVVLLHGFLDLAWSWEPTVRAGLAGRFHIVAPDLRGHGDTDWVGPGGTYHFLDYMADVEEIVGALGR